VSAFGSVSYDAQNGHYYEVVSAPGVGWMNAEQYALTMYYNGLEGHLVIITSADENASVMNVVQRAGLS
jgi:hypothetical protein